MQERTDAMTITLERAGEIVARYALTQRLRDSGGCLVRRGYWFFPVGFIGSIGVIVDASDGALHVMGSGLSRDDCFWGHEHGFSEHRAVLRVIAVYRKRETISSLLAFVVDGPPKQRHPLPRRAWVEDKLRALPCSFAPQSYWLQIPFFRGMDSDRAFDWDLSPSREDGS